MYLASPSQFDVIRLFLTAAWNDGLQVTFGGYRNGQLVDTFQVVASAFTPTAIYFPATFRNIDSFSMIGTGGKNVWSGGDGDQLAIDEVGVCV